MSELRDFPTNSYNYPSGYDKPLTVGPQNFNSPPSTGTKAFYKTPMHFFNCIFFTIGIIVGTLFLSIFTVLAIVNPPEDKSIFYFGYPFIIVWMCGFTIPSGCGALYTSIDIDPFVSLITIKTKKLFCCLSKTRVFEFNNIKKMIIKLDPSTHYRINGVPYNAFKIEVLPTNNEIFEALSGVMDKNFESKKAFDILRNSLPSNIQVENELNNY